MAKKGGVQQLQADIQTDEDFQKFLERPGLLVMDVYTEWCGPCIGMVGSLKKIKLELGGDNLQLAICKSDTIEALKRFRNKSEPTWLFASRGKAVNIMFGTNVPDLMKLIASELKIEVSYREKATQRTFYDITEMQPLEMKRYNLSKAAENAAIQAEIKAAERKRYQYLMFVTNKIIENMPDMGVTIFAPHIHRDKYKKIMEPAESQKLTCKDRRVVQVTQEDLNILHFVCKNRLPDIIWNYFLGKDMLTCLWRTADGDHRPIETILEQYIHDASKPLPHIDDFGNVDTHNMLPPVLETIEIQLTRSGHEIIEKAPIPEASVASVESMIAGDMDVIDMDLGSEEGADEEEEEAAASAVPGVEDNLVAFDDPNDFGKLEEKTSDQEKKEKEKAEKEKELEAAAADANAEKKETIPVQIPPVWAPSDARSMAAAIYVFFRWHTSTFLPPDPVAEPPHLIVAFEAYKRKDIFDVIETCKDDILAYGFFTDDDPDKAKLITNSLPYYETKSHQVNDKLILKVAKKTSHTLLNLAPHGPCYVSANTVIGEKECKKFFPDDYKVETDAELLAQMKPKKKKEMKDDVTEVQAESITDETQKEDDGTEGKPSVVESTAPEIDAAAAASGGDAAAAAPAGAATAPTEVAQETAPPPHKSTEGTAPVDTPNIPPPESSEQQPAAPTEPTQPKQEQSAPTESAPPTEQQESSAPIENPPAESTAEQSPAPAPPTENQETQDAPPVSGEAEQEGGDATTAAGADAAANAADAPQTEENA